MFISTLDLFKIGIGPSSSHTVGPMVAAYEFRQQVQAKLNAEGGAGASPMRLRCTLLGSLAHTGIGHQSDHAVLLGLHGYKPEGLVDLDLSSLLKQLKASTTISFDTGGVCQFEFAQDICFDCGSQSLPHPNTLRFELLPSDDQGSNGAAMLRFERYSIGGGFVVDESALSELRAPIHFAAAQPYPYPFDSAKRMIEMADESGCSIAQMKSDNEICLLSGQKKGNEAAARDQLAEQLMRIWFAMKQCLESGLLASGILPGGLNVQRRAASLYAQAEGSPDANINDYLCAYAMAVNEENAAGHMVVTAPTNGAAGVIPAVLYYAWRHERASDQAIQTFLLTAASIGGLIKHKSSISGAEVGCQGEVGSAAAMAAAGLCAVKGGTARQIENAAEIALEHHLGMTCDPVKGLVQVPCIERNGFGAIKAYTAASLALMGTGEHVMSLDNCINAMRETGLEMSNKYKETALGGLAQSWTEC